MHDFWAAVDVDRAEARPQHEDEAVVDHGHDLAREPVETKTPPDFAERHGIAVLERIEEARGVLGVDLSVSMDDADPRRRAHGNRLQNALTVALILLDTVIHDRQPARDERSDDLTGAILRSVVAGDELEPVPGFLEGLDELRYRIHDHLFLVVTRHDE